MKKFLVCIFSIALLGYFGFRHLSKPSYTCEIVLEPLIPADEFYDVDDFVKFTIEEHMLMIKGLKNIQKSIDDYRLGELYGQDANTLQKEIASLMSVTRIAEGNKLSLRIKNDSEEKAQQIGAAIMYNYGRILLEKKDQHEEHLIKQFKLKRAQQERAVSIARNNLSDLASDLGISFIDPNPYPIARKYSIEKLSGNSEIKLTPEQVTHYAVKADEYMAELNFLDSIKKEEFKRTLHQGWIEPLIIHSSDVSEAVYKFMNKRIDSLNKE